MVEQIGVGKSAFVEMPGAASQTPLPPEPVWCWPLLTLAYRLERMSISLLNGLVALVGVGPPQIGHDQEPMASGEPHAGAPLQDLHHFGSASLGAH